MVVCDIFTPCVHYIPTVSRERGARAVDMQHVIYSIGRIREVLKHMEQRKHTVISRKEGKHALVQYSIAKQNA
jgi:hypothetical protein